MNDSITIEIVSPELRQGNGAPHAIVVTLPTFRRPEHLLKTLASLAAQKTARRFAVIVMENDAAGREGLRAAAPLFADGPLEGLVLVAHERGNCAAYNAGWLTALARFPAMRHLLVIDDDEWAGPDWIERLVETSEREDADFVGAPQCPVFEAGATESVHRHPVFTAPYSRTGPVPILYSSGNVLIRRRVLEAMGPPFLDTAFNFIGGGDSDFYARCRRRGFRFAWCQEAPVFETTPARRTEYFWLQARSLRNGAISTLIERGADASPSGRLKTLAKSFGLLALSPWRFLRLAARTGSPVIALYPIQVAVGRLMAEFGKVNEQYRRPEQN
jgi:GT2 family glycosyltransferase